MSVPGGFDTYRDSAWLGARLREQLSHIEIAELCGADRKTIMRWVDRLGLRHPFLHGNNKFKRLSVRLESIGAQLEKVKYHYAVTEENGIKREFKRIRDAQGYYFEGKTEGVLLPSNPPMCAPPKLAARWRKLQRGVDALSYVRWENDGLCRFYVLEALLAGVTVRGIWYEDDATRTIAWGPIGHERDSFVKREIYWERI